MGLSLKLFSLRQSNLRRCQIWPRVLVPNICVSLQTSGQNFNRFEIKLAKLKLDVFDSISRIISSAETAEHYRGGLLKICVPSGKLGITSVFYLCFVKDDVGIRHVLGGCIWNGFYFPNDD